MKRLAIILCAAIVGFVLFAVGGAWMISLLSSNTHDLSVESAMTGFFAIGPIGAILGAVAGAWFSRPKPDGRAA